MSGWVGSEDSPGYRTYLACRHQIQHIQHAVGGGAVHVEVVDVGLPVADHIVEREGIASGREGVGDDLQKQKQLFCVNAAKCCKLPIIPPLPPPPEAMLHPTPIYIPLPTYGWVGGEDIFESDFNLVFLLNPNPNNSHSSAGKKEIKIFIISTINRYLVRKLLPQVLQ